MSYQPVPKKTPDYDTDFIKDGARSAIIANATALTYIKLPADDPKLSRVYPDLAPKENLEDANGIARSKLCKVILKLPSVVITRTYSDVFFNALLDISVYKEGWADANVRALMVEIIRSLVVNPWTVPGGRLISSLAEGPGTGTRPLSEIDTGVFTRGKGMTIRVIVQRS